MKDQRAVRSSILAQGPKFALQEPSGETTIPREASLDEVIDRAYDLLKAGKAMHAPIRATAGDEFAGMRIYLTEPQQPQGSRPKALLVISIFTDLSSPSAQTDQNFLAYSIQALIVQTFIDRAEPEKALN